VNQNDLHQDMIGRNALHKKAARLQVRYFQLQQELDERGSSSKNTSISTDSNVYSCCLLYAFMHDRPTLAAFAVDSNFDLVIFNYVNEFLYGVL